MKLLIRSAASAATLALLFAHLQASPEQQQTIRQEGYPGPGEPPIVSLISAGAEPRRPLRYRPKAGQKVGLAMTQRMAMTMAIGGAEMPTADMPGVTMGADVAVTNVAANGEISFTIGFTGAKLDGGDPAIREGMQALDADIKTVQAVGVVSDRGVTRSLKMALDKLTSPQLKQSMASMSSSLENLSVPLPEEPVGVGARWEIRQRVDVNGVQVFQKVTSELAAVDGSSVTLKTTLEQTAPPQSMSLPTLPPGTRLSLEKMSGSGSGTSRLRLDELVPTGEADMQSSMLMRMAVGAEEQSMSMNITLHVSIAPVRVSALRDRIPDTSGPARGSRPRTRDSAGTSAPETAADRSR